MRNADMRMLSTFVLVIGVLILGQFAAYRLGYGGLAGPPSKGGTTTFAEIIAGEYRTAYDKLGGGGTVVTVNNVVFHYLQEEQYDGDWHIGSSDPTYRQGDFVIEVAPRDQPSMGRPPLGVRLQIEGVPFCDTLHGQEAEPDGGEGWHTGGSCWEIHPLWAWRLMPTVSVGVGPNVR